MTRNEVIDFFRSENPKITSKVVSNTLLQNWCEVGDKDLCARTRCIVGSEVIDSVVSTSSYSTLYDLTAEISKFYDIDDYPGGGVSFDDDPIDKTTIAQLDQESSGWRTRAAGTPKKWYRWGKWLGFDRPIETADLEIRVYCVLISDDFDSGTKTPFNELSFLEPFHYGLVKYLNWRAQSKISGKEKAAEALAEYEHYSKWMKKEVGASKYHAIQFRPYK